MEATIRVLNEMVEAGVLEGYALGGAMAAVFYIEPVATFDLDVFVTLPSSERDRVVVTLERQYQWLAGRGYEVAGEHVVIESVPVQLLPVFNPLVAEAVADRPGKAPRTRTGTGLSSRAPHGDSRADGSCQGPCTPADVPRGGRVRPRPPRRPGRSLRTPGKVDRVDHVIAPLLAAKALRRLDLAALPIETQDRDRPRAPESGRGGPEECRTPRSGALGSRVPRSDPPAGAVDCRT